MGGGTVTSSAKILLWKCWLITYTWERKRDPSPFSGLSCFPFPCERGRLSCATIAFISRYMKKNPKPAKSFVLFFLQLELTNDIQSSPQVVLAVMLAKMVGNLFSKFPHEAEMHSLLGCGAFCSLQEKMVRSLMMLICNFSVTCFLQRLFGFSETWDLERKKGKWRPWSWTSSPLRCTKRMQISGSLQAYGGIWITSAVLRAVSAP